MDVVAGSGTLGISASQRYSASVGDGVEDPLGARHQVEPLSSVAS